MKVSQLAVDAAGNARVQSGVLVACLCWGVHVRRPQGRPLFRPGPVAAVKPALRIPPPSLHTRGQRGGAAAPPRSRTRLCQAKVPPPEGNLELLVLPED